MLLTTLLNATRINQGRRHLWIITCPAKLQACAPTISFVSKLSSNLPTPTYVRCIIQWQFVNWVNAFSMNCANHAKSAPHTQSWLLTGLWSLRLGLPTLTPGLTPSPAQPSPPSQKFVAGSSGLEVRPGRARVRRSRPVGKFGARLGSGGQVKRSGPGGPDRRM